MKLTQFVGLAQQKRTVAKSRPARVIRATDLAVNNWCPLLFCPEGCRAYVPHDANGLPATAFAFVYAACEVKQLDQVRMLYTAKKYKKNFALLDTVLVQRRVHPTDFMRAQFIAWTGGFHDKKRGKWIDCDFIPPPFMCPNHASLLSLENAEGWQRSWSRYEIYVAERTPLGPINRDPHVLLELSTKLAMLKAVQIKRHRDKDAASCSLLLIKANAQQHKAFFADVRKGSSTMQKLFDLVDLRTKALLVHAGFITQDIDHQTFIDTLSFLKKTQPHEDWLRDALSPLKY